MSRSAPRAASFALAALAALWLATLPESGRAEPNRAYKEALGQRASAQRERGGALYEALCSGCHQGASAARDLRLPDPAWRPGALELFASLDTPARADHDYASLLAEEDLMALTQYIRHEAGLTEVFDDGPLAERIDRTHYVKECAPQIKARVTQRMMSANDATREIGAALWEGACASCHSGGTDAPALHEEATLWRRRPTRMALFNTLHGDRALKAHDAIELNPFLQTWPLLTWMREALIPASKLPEGEEPELPLRGYIEQTCRARSEAIEALAEPAPRAQLLDPSAWLAALPDPGATGPRHPDAERTKRLIAPLDELARDDLGAVAERTCTGCHAEGVPRGATIQQSVRILWGEASAGAHPAYAKALTIAQLSALLHALHGSPETPITPADALAALRAMRAPEENSEAVEKAEQSPKP